MKALQRLGKDLGLFQCGASGQLLSGLKHAQILQRDHKNSCSSTISCSEGRENKQRLETL